MKPNRQFVDKYTPNKQKVMNAMYHFAGKFIHYKDAVILPSIHPHRPLKRLFRYGIVGGNNHVYCHEYDETTFKQWQDNTGNFGIDPVMNNLKNYGYPIAAAQLIAKCGNIAHSKTVRFKDLDFCCTWLGTRNIARGKSNPLSPYNIIKDTIKKQQKKFPNQWNAVLTTVSLRGGILKEGSCKLLKELIELSGAKVKNIRYGDGVKGIQMLGPGHTRKCGKVLKTFHAFEHEVCTNTPSVKVKLFSYNDTVPMFSFVIIHKK